MSFVDESDNFPGPVTYKVTVAPTQYLLGQEEISELM